MSEDITKKKLKIEAEPASFPNAYKFVVERQVYPAGAITFKKKEDADVAPLSRRLFALEGVTKVAIVGAAVTVSSDTAERWPQLAYAVGAGIRAVLEEHEDPATLWPEGVKGSGSGEDLERKKKVQELLDAEINPMIAHHNGMISLVDYDDDVAYVQMLGGCQGCGAADATLKMGVERMLKERVPEIREIVDVTNHAEGSNPYISAGK